MNTSDFYANHHDARLRQLGSRLSTRRAEQHASMPGRFSHLQPAIPDVPDLRLDLVTLTPDLAARAIVAAGDRARGQQTSSPADWIAGPAQNPRLASGDAILRIARRQGLAR
jgi:hypothetical protein